MNRIPCRNKGYGLEHSTGHGINKARDTVMSDSEDSTVTYTVVSSPFADLPDIGSPGVDGPTVMPEDPYAYVVAAFQASSSPDYVSVLTEEQPLPAAASPTADSPGYVPEEDPKEDDDEDPEEDPADYPANGGDDGDDDDDEDEDVVSVDHAPSAKETEPFETDESVATPPPHPAYRVIASRSDFEVGESSSAPTARPLDVLGQTMILLLLMKQGDYAGSRERYDIYTRLDDEQSERQLMAGRLNMLYRDRRTHARTARLVEAKARMSREALGTIHGADDPWMLAVITELQAADRRRQAAITELLAADRRRQAQFIETLKLLKRLQTQMTEFERQQGPAKGPT
ncbi:hypothetical protein Tco_0174294 [Tanacetum coccineum]